MEAEFGPNRPRWLLWCGVVLTCAGCASTRLTDTSRSGMEQLLVSTAIDSSLDKIDFESIAGRNVCVDDRFLECIDKKYVIGSVRQRVFEAGCRLVETVDEAEIVLELYSGAVGTDRSEGFIGTPAVSVPGPVPIQLPEIKLLSQTSQFGTAKIGVVAYDATTKRALSAGGLSRARSENSHWAIMGVVPFTSGNLRNEIALTKRLQTADQRIVLSERHPQVPPNWISPRPVPPTYSSPGLQLPPANTENTMPGAAPFTASGVPDIPTLTR